MKSTGVGAGTQSSVGKMKKVDMGRSCWQIQLHWEPWLQNQLQPLKAVLMNLDECALKSPSSGIQSLWLARYGDAF